MNHRAITQGSLDVVYERNRQIADKGFTAAHDQKNQHQELVAAAICYADLYLDLTSGVMIPDDEPVPIEWPGAWEDRWNPKDQRSNLVRAAALLIAEIDRLDAQEVGDE